MWQYINEEADCRRVFCTLLIYLRVLSPCCLQCLNHLLSIPGENDAALSLAVDCVGKAEDNKLTSDLVRFLMGDADGVPKVTLSGGICWRTY